MPSLIPDLALSFGVAREQRRRCRICGCTDPPSTDGGDCFGCVERTGEPCYWVEPDLCSACRLLMEMSFSGYDPEGEGFWGHDQHGPVHDEDLLALVEAYCQHRQDQR